MKNTAAEFPAVGSKTWDKVGWLRWSGIGQHFQAGQHEVHEMGPIVNQHVAQQSAQVVEKSPACDQGFSQQLVVLIHQIQERMEQKSRQVAH